MNNHKPKKLIKIGIGILAVLAIFFVFINFSQEKEQENGVEKIKITQQNYSTLINNWNDQVQNIKNSKEFLLPRGDNKKLIAKLNSMVKPFFDFDKKELEEYKNTKDTARKEYYKFIKKNFSKNKVYFSSEMKSEKIKKQLKQLTNESAINHQLVSKILMMNSFEIFFQFNYKKVE